MGITGNNQRTLCVYFTWYILERGGVILQATLQVLEATCVDRSILLGNKRRRLRLYAPLLVTCYLWTHAAIICSIRWIYDDSMRTSVKINNNNDYEGDYLMRILQMITAATYLCLFCLVIVTANNTTAMMLWIQIVVPFIPFRTTLIYILR